MFTKAVMVKIRHMFCTAGAGMEELLAEELQHKLCATQVSLSCCISLTACKGKNRKFYETDISQTFFNHQTATRVHVRDYEQKNKIRGPNNCP